MATAQFFICLLTSQVMLARGTVAGVTVSSSSQASGNGSASASHTVFTSTSGTAPRISITVANEESIKGIKEKISKKLPADKVRPEEKHLASFVKQQEEDNSADELVNGILKNYKEVPISSFINDTLAALDEGGDTAIAYIHSLEAIHDTMGCLDFKIHFAGRTTAMYPVSELSSKIDACLFPSCELLHSSMYCCGLDQKNEDQCTCEYGDCKWIKPKYNTVGKHFFWECNRCGEETEACRCL